MNLKTSVCKCSRSYIPNRSRCAVCGSSLSEKEISAYGEILTFTTVYTVPEGFTAPISLALVQLEHNTKILCVSKCNEMKIGKKVKVECIETKYYCMDV